MNEDRSHDLSLAAAFHPVASTREIGRDPVARTLLGRAIVLFRDGKGRVVALEDRCLHRHVALSIGRVREGTIECAYHGWRFDGKGACVGLPCAAPGEPMPQRTIPSFLVEERQGTVWVHMGETPPTTAAAWPEELDRYPFFELVTIIECPVLWVVNNFVDCAHTGFVHKGIFRGSPHRLVRARIEETPTGVRIETFGETDPSSLLALLMVPRGETVRHTDEVILPHTVRVDYWLGKDRHILTTSICTPETDGRTRVVTRVGIRFPLFAPALLPVLERSTRTIMAQDKLILENQATQLAKHGRRFLASSAADAPTAWVTRAYDAAAEGRFPPAELRSKEVEYLL